MHQRHNPGVQLKSYDDLVAHLKTKFSRFNDSNKKHSIYLNSIATGLPYSVLVVSNSENGLDIFKLEQDNETGTDRIISTTKGALVKSGINIKTGEKVKIKTYALQKQATYPKKYSTSEIKEKLKKWELRERLNKKIPNLFLSKQYDCIAQDEKGYKTQYIITKQYERTLQDFISDSSTTAADLKQVYLNLCKQYNKLNKNGYFHGKLSMNNILIGENNEVILSSVKSIKKNNFFYRLFSAEKYIFKNLTDILTQSLINFVKNKVKLKFNNIGKNELHNFIQDVGIMADQQFDALTMKNETVINRKIRRLMRKVEWLDESNLDLPIFNVSYMLKVKLINLQKDIILHYKNKNMKADNFLNTLIDSEGRVVRIGIQCERAVLDYLESYALKLQRNYTSQKILKFVHENRKIVESGRFNAAPDSGEDNLYLKRFVMDPVARSGIARIK